MVGWNDNGTPLVINSTFFSAGYVNLDPTTVVTPDTTKPGFKFNIFENLADPFANKAAATAVNLANGLQIGETDFLDNTELGLNGLLPDGSGGYLPNMVTLWQ